MKTSSINRPFLFYKHQLLPEQSEEVGSFPTNVAVATPTRAGPATGSLINSTAKGLTLKLIFSFSQFRNGCFKDRCGHKESEFYAKGIGPNRVSLLTLRVGWYQLILGLTMEAKIQPRAFLRLKSCCFQSTMLG